MSSLVVSAPATVPSTCRHLRQGQPRCRERVGEKALRGGAGARTAAAVGIGERADDGGGGGGGGGVEERGCTKEGPRLSARRRFYRRDAGEGADQRGDAHERAEESGVGAIQQPHRHLTDRADDRSCAC